MENPFKAVKDNEAGMFHSAEGSDCARGQAEAAAVVVSPIVAAWSFVAAFFKKSIPAASGPELVSQKEQGVVLTPDQEKAATTYVNAQEAKTLTGQS